MPSTMGPSHSFAQVPTAEIQRSTFDRSHGHKTTFDEGYLIPVYVDEVLPGDTFNLTMTAFARLATPLKPLMDNMYLDSFFFFVPTRLVWAHFPNFMGEEEVPGSPVAYSPPVFDSHVVTTGSLSDYMGCPLAGGVAYQYCSLWHRAYNLIYNEWFRDENLCTKATHGTGDTNDTIGNFVLKKRGKRHDYFTSCLPWPQKGTAVSIPLGTSAPVKGIAFPTASDPVDGNPGGTLETGGGAPNAWAGYMSSNGFTVALRAAQANAGGPPVITADLTGATAATINELRQAFQVQKMLERDARGGTRYTELIKSHFGVTSPDARLQRPEYLGGGSTPIIISPIAQNSDVQRTDAGAAKAGSTPQGNLSAIGTATATGHGFSKSFTEHGLLLGIVSVRSDLTYSQGLNRMFKRLTRYDFYWPALAHLGEQSVLNQELYMQANSNDALTFGYQERYAEYRYKPSLITGLFRPDAAGTLDIWHLSQKFTALPTLNATFIEEPTGSTAPLYRTLAVPTEPHIIFDSWFRLITARPMPVFGVPGLIDHF